MDSSGWTWKRPLTEWISRQEQTISPPTPIYCLGQPEVLELSSGAVFCAMVAFGESSMHLCMLALSFNGITTDLLHREPLSICLTLHLLLLLGQSQWELSQGSVVWICKVFCQSLYRAVSTWESSGWWCLGLWTCPLCLWSYIPWRLSLGYLPSWWWCCICHRGYCITHGSIASFSLVKQGPHSNGQVDPSEIYLFSQLL